jgi:hypothetical protein
MGVYSRIYGLRVRRHLILHQCTLWVFCWVSRRGNPLRSRVASHDSKAKNLQIY